MFRWETARDHPNQPDCRLALVWPRLPESPTLYHASMPASRSMIRNRSGASGL